MVISVFKEEYSKKEILSSLNPLVAKWFERFEDLTPPQRYAIPLIQRRNNTLIASPTGSGKTLAAFISIISELANLSMKDELEETVYCVYISPLRSLSNDIRKNLLEPLEGIDKIADEIGEKRPSIRIATRTGDTTQAERSRMLRQPPHILVTTPESLAIMLIAPKFKEKLRSIQWVIVDEIHEICSSKRGVHLSLTLERLERLCSKAPARVGLSATIHPLEDVARYLVGYKDGKERDCFIVDTRFVKPMKLLVSAPVDDLLKSNSERTSNEMYRQIKDIVRNQKTTLIFTNTRSGTERVVYHLSRLNAVDLDELAAHHSSLSRDIRLSVEDRLKKGKMRVVVTSTSLELGIDIGSIDLVIQIGSPKSISRCLQRVGRSGHSLKKVSKGILIGLERDDLVEDAVIAIEAMKGRLDRVYIPRNCLDVLAQHIVGMALEKKWSLNEALRLIRRSYCFSDLSKDSFIRVLRYLSGMYGALEGFRVYGKIWYDESEQKFGRRGALLRAIYATNIGTIPDEVAVKVYDERNRWVGSIEEEFLERLARGDLFTLAGRVYRFNYSRGFKAYVTSVKSGKPTVPTWFSEMLPLSFDLGESIGRFRAEIFSYLNKGINKKEVSKMICEWGYVDERAANAIVNYFDAERKFLKSVGIDAVPDNRNIIIENYIDEEGRQNVIFNCVFGRRVHDALSRAFAEQVREDTKKNVMISVLDSCFSLTLPKGVRYNINELVRKVNHKNIRSKLISAVRNTELVRRRFRHCAARALMVLRNYKGHEIRAQKQQLNSQILLSVCEKLDSFPILEEAYREVIEDLMDVKTAELVLREISEGKRNWVICPEMDIASPFTHELLVSGYSDVVLMEDRRALLNALYEAVMKRIEEGKIFARGQ